AGREKQGSQMRKKIFLDAAFPTAGREPSASNARTLRDRRGRGGFCLPFREAQARAVQLGRNTSQRCRNGPAAFTPLLTATAGGPNDSQRCRTGPAALTPLLTVI